MMTDDYYEQALKIFSEASSMEDKGDLDSAIMLYKQAADMAFSPAYTNLGNIYDDKMVPNNPEMAVKLYTRAVDLGDGVGAYCLALHYRNLGEVAKEEHWLRRAAELGYSDV